MRRATRTRCAWANGRLWRGCKLQSDGSSAVSRVSQAMLCVLRACVTLWVVRISPPHSCRATIAFSAIVAIVALCGPVHRVEPRRHHGRQQRCLTKGVRHIQSSCRAAYHAPTHRDERNARAPRQAQCGAAVRRPSGVHIRCYMGTGSAIADARLAQACASHAPAVLVLTSSSNTRRSPVRHASWNASAESDGGADGDTPVMPGGSSAAASACIGEC